MHRTKVGESWRGSLGAWRLCTAVSACPQVYRQMDPNATDSEEERCEDEDLVKLKAREISLCFSHHHFSPDMLF